MEYNEFEKMNLKENLLRGIYANGFNEPSKIQSQVIPYFSLAENGKFGDLLAQSQSGTGKTGSFLISALQLIDPEIKEIQCIILAPTKELAAQIHTVCVSLNSFLKYNIESCIGGSKLNNIIEAPGIIIGTPGRVLEIINKEYFDINYLKLFVLDEADEMLSANFEEQIYQITKKVPKTTRLGMFSATLTREIIDISKKIMNNPLIIKLEPEEITLEGIKQYYIHCEKDIHKFDALCEIYNKLVLGQTFIYVNSRSWGEKLKKLLENEGFVISFIHSGLNSYERNRIMKDFSTGYSRILLSTNLLARGIDVQQVSVVINYDVPISKETYIHRIGRSGRFGRKGLAINLVSDKDVFVIDELESFYSTKMENIKNIEDIEFF